MKKINKKSLLSVFVLLLFTTLFSQESLTKFNTSWTSVLPGAALCEPENTSYGFCLATDARNIMGYSSNGTLLWEKNIGRVRNLSLTALKGDFILLHDKDKNIIRLFNPSGSEIWSQPLDFNVSSKPLEGRDGRFFINGEKTVVCFGINGIQRWKLETEYQKELPMQELPDGSIVVFLNDEGGKTRGLRISPFGEELENITFTGVIKTAYTCKDGILLTFTDGSAGLFALKDGLAESQWVANVQSGNSIFAVNRDKTEYRLLALSKAGITVYKLRSSDGFVEESKTVNEIDGTALIKAELSDSGLFLADSNKALLIDYEYKELWYAVMPVNLRNNTINQFAYLHNDYLVFCSKNWTMDAYHTNDSKSVLKSIHSDYSSFAPIDLVEINYYTQAGFFNALKDPAITSKIKEGNFGKKESQWLTQTLSLARLYFMDATTSNFGTHTEKSVFETDSAGFETVLIQLALLCTDQTQAAAASIISESTSKLYCRTLLANITGYDPDGKLLDAIERNVSRSGSSDSVYLNTVCDAVYSICLFMGRPAYNKKGKDILKTFMGAGFSFKTRSYARDTLKKIMALEL